jgi:hypothetical protein
MPPPVGYASPPISTRFRKGRSGNPKGRPKGRRNFETLLIEALSERITINENGQRKRVTKAEAGAKQVANKVASGDAKLMLKLAQLLAEKRDLIRDEKGPIKLSLPPSASALDRLTELTARIEKRIAARRPRDSGWVMNADGL